MRDSGLPLIVSIKFNDSDGFRIFNITSDDFATLKLNNSVSPIAYWIKSPLKVVFYFARSDVNAYLKSLDLDLPAVIRLELTGRINTDKLEITAITKKMFVVSPPKKHKRGKKIGWGIIFSPVFLIPIAGQKFKSKKEEEFFKRINQIQP